MLEHGNFIWGTKCECGKEDSILQNKFHPWSKTDFIVTLQCQCGNKVEINQEKASLFYNQKILSYFMDVSGRILDLGCGGGFLTYYLKEIEAVEEVIALDIEEVNLDWDKVTFIHDDLMNLNNHFTDNSIDYLVSRDTFMFVEDTETFFNDITKIVSKGIQQMGWYMKDNERMKNLLHPEDIKKELEQRGWKVELEYLDWYKCGYFIKANKE